MTTESLRNLHDPSAIRTALTRRRALGGLAAAGMTLTAPSIARAARPRIVTIGGGVTETVFALGRGGEIVATDAASLCPDAASMLPKISYPRAIDAEALAAQRPDLVLAADEAGPQAALDAVASSGARIVRMPEMRRAEDVAAGVRMIGEAVGERTRADALAETLAADLSLIEDGLRGVASRRRALVLLGEPDAAVLVTAGRGSPGAFALAFAGADNAAEAISGWNWIAPSAARDLDPDAVVALSGEGMVSVERVLAAPGVRGTTAGRERRIANADTLAFAGFGPRAAHAIHAVAARIYPEARLAPLPPRGRMGLENAAL